MNNWRGYLMIAVLGGALLFVLVAPFYILKQSSDCRDKGGVPTRVGCLKPGIFVE